MDEKKPSVQDVIIQNGRDDFTWAIQDQTKTKIAVSAKPYRTAELARRGLERTLKIICKLYGVKSPFALTVELRDEQAKANSWQNLAERQRGTIAEATRLFSDFLEDFDNTYDGEKMQPERVEWIMRVRHFVRESGA